MGTRVAKAGHVVHGGSARFVERLRSLFTEQLWTVPMSELGRGKALLFRVAQVGYSTIRGFIDHQLTVRAAALTYFSALSIVPFLAFAFAVLKGLGAYASFIEGTVRPYIRETFGANQALLDATEQILRFVDRTDVSTLGAVGLLVLVYTSVSLLSSIEDALNETWGVKARRPFLRQLTNYVTLLVTTPLLILVAATFSTAAQSSKVVLFLRDTFAVGSVLQFLLRFTSVAVVAIALFAIYMVLPNVRTRVASALVGAAVSAVLWQGALILYVQFQMGVAGYSALYSALGAVPIFLVWTYVSWVIVLVGAQVAASHQSRHLIRQRFQAERTDQALKEMLAVVVAAHVARDFVSGPPHHNEATLAEELGVAEPVIHEVVEALVRAGVLARAVTAHETSYLPGRDVDGIHLKDIQDALRQDQRAETIRTQVERDVPPELGRLFHDAEEDRRHSGRNVSLRQLAAMVGEHGAAIPPSR